MPNCVVPKIIMSKSTGEGPAPVALLVVSLYALPGYSDRRVWVRDTGWLDHCVRL